MIEKIKGVSIEIFFDGQPLGVEEDGYAGKLKAGGRATIKVVISPERDDVYGFIVQGRQKEVVEKSNKAAEMRLPQEGKIYTLKIPVEESRSDYGIAHTYSNTNNMQLTQLDADGSFQMWKIALISQAGDFFLTVQKTYNGRCYRDGDRVVCPMFDTRFGARKNWLSMIEFLAKLLAGKIENLDPITEYKPEPEVTADGLEKNTGQVLFWNFASQNGAIITSEGEVVSAYWKEVPARPRLRYLIPGEVVKFDSLGSHPQKFERPSEFKKRAVGIKPIS